MSGKDRPVKDHLATAVRAFTRWAGSAWIAGAGTLLVIGLVVAGIVTGFPHWWQVTVYSTGALLSVLMLVTIQHTNARHTHAVLLKLDELLDVTRGADSRLIDVENREIQEQEQLAKARKPDH
jgi:low affinity Fe/Cu permease